ncbi:MAG TPA: transcriptional regulator [Pyrinomonadaceae bacterium]|nr:transcriptional regulator [Pyrinomonadaceae bacterium]
MSHQTKHFYGFGDFRLDVSERVLLRGGEIVPLTAKAFEVLLALVERDGGIAGKDELMRRVWPDSFVEESNLAQNIYTLRKTLGQTDDGHEYIKTVPRRGYRFGVGVRETREEVERVNVSEPVDRIARRPLHRFRLLSDGRASRLADEH